MKKLNTFYGFRYAVCRCIFVAVLVSVSGCAGAGEIAVEVWDRNPKIIKSEHNYHARKEIMADSWEEFDWENPPKQIRHEAPEDIRKRIYLTSVGKYANAIKTVKQPRVPGTETIEQVYFALAWEDILLPFPGSDIVYETSGPFPTNCDSNTKLPGVRPGSVYCWFERSFSHPIQGVTKTGDDYEFIFNKTEITKDEIYTQNGCTIDIDGSQETWVEEEDDFRPGTPFTITGTPDNDGFYRVKSVTTDALHTYVRVDNNKYEQQDLIVTGSGGTAKCEFGGDWYQFLGHDGNSESQYNTNGGDMTEYLNTLDDSVYNPGISPEWWTAKDGIHRYEETGGEVTFGPKDGRPPTGGLLSKDFNGSWIRSNNPSLYHTYDDNSHRWIVRSETDGSQPPDPGGTYEQFTSIVPSSEFLCFQADPREIVSPFRFEDTSTTKWKYGSKVKIRATQLTDPDTLGAIGDVIRSGYITGVPTFVPTSRHSQYQTAYLTDPPGGSSGNRTVLGDWPSVGSQNPKSIWINNKYNKSLQNMVESVIESTIWTEKPDTTYKNNWITIFGNSGIVQIDVSTWDEWEDSPTSYSIDDEVKVGLQVYVSLQNSNEGHSVGETDWWRKYTFQNALADFNLDTAWQPELNPTQPFFADADDEMWGENGSKFEYFLSKTGNFDWYYDTDHPFRSKRTLDDAWEWWETTGEASHPLPATYNGIACTTAEDVKNAYWRIPAGTWRKTWKYSLGKPQNNPMNDGDDAPPTFEDYESLSVFPPDFNSNQGQYGGSDFTDDDNIMYGHLRMTSTTPTDDPAIAERHEESYTIKGHKIYADAKRILSILKQARQVLEGLSYAEESTSIELIWRNISLGFGAVTPQSSEEAFREATDDFIDIGVTPISDFESPSVPVIGSSPEYQESAGTWFSDGGTSRAHVMAIKLTATSIEVDQLLSGENGRELNIVLGARTVPASSYYDSNGDLNKFFRTPGIKGEVEIRCLVDDFSFYGLGKLNVDEATEIVFNNGIYEYYFLLYPLQNSNQQWITETDKHLSDDYSAANVAGVSLESAEKLSIKFDWDDFPNSIFTRDYERADYKLTDPAP